MKALQKLAVVKKLDDCVDHLLSVIQRNDRCDDACELADVICKLRTIIREMSNPKEVK